MGQNIFTKHELKDTELHSLTPQFFSFHDSFGIFQQGTDLSLSLASFLNARGFNFGSSPHGCTIAITIPWSLRLK
jgi:hypothetical protein